MEERRKSVRIGQSLAVTYQPVGQFLRPSSRSSNLSMGGICLAIYHRMQPGTALKMWIELKDVKDPIIASSQVMWIKETHDPSYPYQVGIKFTEINPSDKHKLLNEVRRICKQENIPYVGPLE
jgi:c-di-GMP-binding flagellar brake protein YcgR